MWPAWENNKTKVEGAVVDLVNRIEKSLSDELEK
jgi:hypothetical protein